jgi:type IV pilus assembly PilN-like protein
MVSRAHPDQSAKKGARTGIAISATSLCAADARLRGAGDTVWRASLDAPPPENGHWPSLASALAELARAIGGSPGTLAISLMPPFTEVRRLELPPLKDDELPRVLARQASRYFVAAKTPQIVGASHTGKRVRGAPAPVVAAAAPARLVGAIRAAAEQTGWTIEVVAPAESAWAAAALALWPSFARESSFALVAHEDRTDLLQFSDGRLSGVRRFRASAGDAPMIADTVGPSKRVGILGSMPPRRELSSALSALGVAVTPPSGEWSSSAERPDQLAAQFAGSDVGPSLRGEETIRLEAAAALRATRVVAAVAAALLVAAAGIELWGVHHQLTRVRAERDRIHPEIATTMVGRTTVEAAYQQLATLNGIERAAPQWSSVIATLTDALPDDAHLLAMRTRDDSVIVDGVADRAAKVFNALERARQLTGVKAAAAVRREIQEGGSDALEHFVIAARVAPPASSSTTPASNPVPARPQR